MALEILGVLSCFFELMFEGLHGQGRTRYEIPSFFFTRGPGASNVCHEHLGHNFLYAKFDTSGSFSNISGE